MDKCKTGSQGCFICDKTIIGTSKNIVSATTSHTNTPLIDKLGNFVGNDYIVIVNQDDRVCGDCLSLFDKIDELEYDLNHFQNILNDLLTKKYAIFSNASGDSYETVEEKEEVHEKNTLEIIEKIDNRKKPFKTLKISKKNIDSDKKHFKTLQKSKKNLNTTKDAMYFCSICEVKIANKNNLKRHVSRKHIIKKGGNKSNKNIIYKCRLCLQQFPSEELCQNHVEVNHSDNLKCNDSTSNALERCMNTTSNAVVKSNIVLVPSDGEDYQNGNKFKEHQEIVINERTNVKLTIVGPSDFDSSVGLKSTIDSYENYSIIQDEEKCLECNLINEMMNCINGILGEKKHEFIRCGKCNKIQNHDKLDNHDILEQLVSNSIKSNGKICENSLMKCLNSLCNNISTKKLLQLKDEIIGIMKNNAESRESTLKKNMEHAIHLFNNRIAEKLNSYTYNSMEITDESRVSTPTLQKNMENAINLFHKTIAERLNSSTDIEDIDENFKINPENSCNSINYDEHGTYGCAQCNFTFKTELSLIKHLQDCHDFLICVVCNLVFDDSNLLNSHIIESHPDWDSSSYCQACNKNFEKKMDLINHIKCTHLLEKFCPICSKQFKNKALFLKHIEFGHRDNLLCHICNNQLNDLDELITHERSHKKKEFVCEICSKILKTRSSLKAHKISLHTGEYPYICEICGKGFISTHTLNEHKSKHNKESRYICDICGKGYRLYDTYHKHRNHHDNPYPKQCNICHQYFRSSSRLAEHKRRKHTLERPYKCPYCSLSFHISSLLKHHLFKHTREYPYTCVTCKKGYPSRIKYASHMAKKHKDDSLIRNRFPNNKERQEEWLKYSRENS